MAHDGLLETLGGADGVRAVVGTLYERLLDDPSVAPYFDDVELPTLRVHMTDFLVAALTGRTVGYRGRPIDVAHRGLGITDVAFDNVVGHLAAALAGSGVDDPAIGEVADLLAPLRPQVVEVH